MASKGRPNDHLTFEVAALEDGWLHVAGGIPGSHVIVRHLDKLETLPPGVVRRAAELAAWHSKARHARNRDLTETLEQQTATGEVHKVISRSAFDLQPVFEVLAENAVRLCDAERAFIFRFDGGLLRAAASNNASPELVEAVRRNPIAPGTTQRHRTRGA